ncbi:MAG: hypothetical protein N3C62_04560 [Synergistetes bacterium]|nr:hypothetical protein [Synergistota bacterium]MCX8127986.1 hypothetical protein [Synergistota bacterium]MDW8192819.1 hypothetical protein [Synergistota bacterium]
MVIKHIIDFLKGFSQGLKENAISLIELECAEYENLFALLVVGGLVGMPSPPTTLSLRLLPFLEHELRIMTSMTLNLDDAFGRIAGYFEA